MPDRSHKKLHSFIEKAISDPMIASVMKADGLAFEEVKLLLARAALGVYLPSSNAISEGESTSCVAVNRYRRGVGIALFDRRGRVCVGRRNDLDVPCWQMPQGGIDRGEMPREAALRELHEEMGTDNVEILAEMGTIQRYELPKELIGKAWHGAWIGQEQRWFAMRFLGQDADINVRTEHPEFSDWRWVDLPTLVEIAPGFKKTVYSNVAKEFAPFAALSS